MQSIQTMVKWLRSDGRHFQIISQIAFLLLGVLLLGWDSAWLNYAMIFLAVFAAQGLAIRFAGYPLHSLKSACITGLGLALLMKANDPVLYLFAALLSIGMKFLTKVNGKHLWNPANFGIVTVAALSNDAWISPGQWGSNAIILFVIGTAGLAVLSNIRRLETGIVFLTTFAILEFVRTILYLGWEHDVFLLKLSSGSLWLFAFFMITDPMTTPNHPKVRIVWAMTVALVSFYLANFKFINGAPFWTLFFLTPLTPLLDYFTPHFQSFNWKSSHSKKETIQQSSL